MPGFDDAIRNLFSDGPDSAALGRMLPLSESSPSENTDRDTKKFTKVPNEILEKLISFGFTRRELLVVLVMIRKTCGWHKDLDSLSYSQISELTGVDTRHVRRTILRLRDAHVLLCGGYRPDGHPYQWGIDTRVELWDYKMLREKRKSAASQTCKSMNSGSAKERAKMAPFLGAKLALGVGAESAPGGEGRKSPLQKKELKKESKKGLKKYGAAFAARPSSSFSSSLSKPDGEKERGSIGTPKDLPSVKRRGRVTETQMARNDQVRIAQLCSELEARGVNPYPWLAEKRRKGALACPLISVLEKAIVQKPGAAEFDAFAEKVFGEICSNG